MSTAAGLHAEFSLNENLRKHIVALELAANLRMGHKDEIWEVQEVEAQNGPSKGEKLRVFVPKEAAGEEESICAPGS